MELFTEKKNCCGCSACKDACPADAIQMVLDREGFWYPWIDRKLCVGCKRCEQVCPIKHPAGEKQQNIYFGVQAKEDAVRYASSSGGMFSVLAEYVLRQQGVVWGAAYNEKMEVVHTEVKDREELDGLRRTKYVQSNLDGVFRRIKEALNEGKWLLFCGTPCQVHALKLFLGKSYPKLILADLICYGVPSPGIWNSYVKHLEKKHGGKMKAFFFRDKRKRDSGHTCSYVIGETEYVGNLNDDPYCRLYFENNIIRPSCHACKYCTVNRDSDFTLGDFWGIEKVKPEVDDGMGNSMVILHTDKARRIWNQIKDDLRWFPCEEYQVNQPRLENPTKPARWRGLFLRFYQMLPFSLFLFLVTKFRFIIRRGKKKILHISNVFKGIEWEMYKKRKRNKLKNQDFSIIGPDCNASFIYYDLGLKYLTPTVNLAIPMDDFVKMIGNLEWYMEQEITEIKDAGKCPAGLLGDVRINFVHYKTFAEGVKKWEERKKRICWDNLFIMGTERGSCNYETLQRFEQLPYKNKVLFTKKEYPEFPSTYYIKGFEQEKELGVLLNFKKQFLKRRYLDDFDYVSFLNRPVEEKFGGK